MRRTRFPSPARRGPALRSPGWAALTGFAASGLVCGLTACTSTKHVDPIQSSDDAAVDATPPASDAVAPLPDLGVTDAAPPLPDAIPDTGICEPPSLPIPPAPEGRCGAVTDADPFTDVPCGAPVVLPSLEHPAEVVFTEMGVPHVYAQSLTDAARIQGYLLARDRFFEMDLTRRNTLGKLGGWFSQLGLGTDIDNRTKGEALAARRIYERGSSPEMKSVFDAYAEGVNFYIDRVLAGEETRPEEFTILGDIITIQPTEKLMDHWTGLDVAAGAAAITYALAFDGEDLDRSLALGMSATFGANLPKADLRNAAAVTDIVGDLRPIRSVAQTVVGPAKPGAPTSAKSGGLGVPPGLREAITRVHARWAKQHDPDADTGSNTWAVDAAHGVDGIAYLASDPHLSLGAPTFFYQMHMDTKLLSGDAGGISAAGVSLPGTPYVVIGETERLAWGITNLNADDTDYYLEHVELQNGRPATTQQPGQVSAAIVSVDETYDIAQAPTAGVPAPQTCVIPRYETADGRMLIALEGTPVEGDVDCGAPPEGAVNIDGDWLVPGDVDNDGVVTGISMDFTGLDPNPVAMTVHDYLTAQNIDDFMQAQRHSGVFNNAQAVADVEGHVATTGFHAVPKREYLRGPDGNWAPGGNPTLLIDATQFPSFEVTLDDQYRVVTDSADPRQQMIGFDEWPRLVNPPRGFVVSANNELTGGTFDNDTGNERPYVGWNFDIGFRSERITELLAGFTGAGTPVGVEQMARVQNDHRSNYANLLLGRMLHDLPAAGCGHALAADAVRRLTEWQTRGLEAASGVETFYHRTVDATETDDAAATMIFNEWVAALMHDVLDDEHLDGVHWNGGGTDGHSRFLAHMILSPEDMAGFDSETNDHVFWDDTTTPAVETRGETLCKGLGDALEHLRGTENGGFSNDDPSTWMWGLRHTLHFAHTFEPILGGSALLAGAVAPLSIAPPFLPVAGCLPDGDTRATLPGFPRPGDNFGVDASTAGWNAQDWSYGSGPVQRLIVRLEAGKVKGEVILPGGQSGFPGSPFWADQARLWLGNQRHPIHFAVDEVKQNAVQRWVFQNSN